MKICEIFASIQGESTLQGVPSVFVRLAGCNLNCRYCDTAYAREGGTEMSLEKICRCVDDYGLEFVCITGGEPLLQKETSLLAIELLYRGYTVSLETNGTFDTSGLHEDIIRIIDIKCPGSGEHGKTFRRNISKRRQNAEFKFVITDRADFDYAISFVRKHGLDENNPILLSPAWGFLEPEVLAEWIIKEMPGARLNLQIHKYIWPDESRGR